MGIFGKSAIQLELESKLRNEIKNLEGEIEGAGKNIANAFSQAETLRNDEAAARACKWDYFFIEDIEDSELSRHGAKGWELVSAVSYQTGWGIGGNEKMIAHVRYIFKRPANQEFPLGAKSHLDEVKLWESRKRDFEGLLDEKRADLRRTKV